TVGRDAPRRPAAGGAWPIERAWDRGAELLYSAWIERLFDDPLDAEPSWQHLEPVLGDPARNFLHDHLRLDEDGPGRLHLEPDGTVARKRYWRGNFLFAVDPALGGAGFKHFRPVIAEGRGLRALGNREIAADRDYGDFSLEQYDGDADDFYDRMDDLLSPTPM